MPIRILSSRKKMKKISNFLTEIFNFFYKEKVVVFGKDSYSKLNVSNKTLSVSEYLNKNVGNLPEQLMLSLRSDADVVIYILQEKNKEEFEYNFKRFIDVNLSGVRVIIIDQDKILKESSLFFQSFKKSITIEFEEIITMKDKIIGF
jgi:hypothetical protein